MVRWTAPRLFMAGAVAASLSLSLAEAREPASPVLPFTVTDEAGLPGFFSCLRGRTTMISAHRGGVEPGFPENAIETMGNTLAQAPMLMELDVRSTRDGVLVLMHDETLDRTTTGQGLVRETDWAVVKELVLEDNDGTETIYRVPTLEDAIRWAKGKTILQLDVKRAEDLADVVALIKAEGAEAHALVIVYSVGGAETVHGIDPSIMLSIGIEGEGTLAALKEGGVAMDRFVGWTGVGQVKADLWELLRERGVSVAFGALWTIDKDIEESGNEGLYADVTAKGVDILATDRHHQAYDAIQVNGSTAEALRACATTR